MNHSGRLGRSFSATCLNTLLLSAAFVSTASIANAQDPDLEKGKTIYNGIGACAGCHGATGAGDGVAGAALTPKPRSFVTGDYKYDTDGDGKTGTEADIVNIIGNGAQKYGGSMFMVGRPDISEADRKAVAKYILSLKK